MSTTTQIDGIIEHWNQSFRSWSETYVKPFESQIVRNCLFNDDSLEKGHCSALSGLLPNKGNICEFVREHTRPQHLHYLPNKILSDTYACSLRMHRYQLIHRSFLSEFISWKPGTSNALSRAPLEIHYGDDNSRDDVFSCKFRKYQLESMKKFIQKSPGTKEIRGVWSVNVADDAMMVPFGADDEIVVMFKIACHPRKLCIMYEENSVLRKNSKIRKQTLKTSCWGLEKTRSSSRFENSIVVQENYAMDVCADNVLAASPILVYVRKERAQSLRSSQLKFMCGDVCKCVRLRAARSPAPHSPMMEELSSEHEQYLRDKYRRNLLHISGGGGGGVGGGGGSNANRKKVMMKVTSAQMQNSDGDYDDDDDDVNVKHNENDENKNDDNDDDDDVAWNPVKPSRPSEANHQRNHHHNSHSNSNSNHQQNVFENGTAASSSSVAAVVPENLTESVTSTSLTHDDAPRSNHYAYAPLNNRPLLPSLIDIEDVDIPHFAATTPSMFDSNGLIGDGLDWNALSSGNVFDANLTPQLPMSRFTSLDQEWPTNFSVYDPHTNALPPPQPQPPAQAVHESNQDPPQNLFPAQLTDFGAAHNILPLSVPSMPATVTHNTRQEMQALRQQNDHLLQRVAEQQRQIEFLAQQIGSVHSAQQSQPPPPPLPYTPLHPAPFVPRQPHHSYPHHTHTMQHAPPHHGHQPVYDNPLLFETRPKPCKRRRISSEALLPPAA